MFSQGTLSPSKTVCDDRDDGEQPGTDSFDEPVRAAAPGQSAVFYNTEGCVIGGGIIARVL